MNRVLVGVFAYILLQLIVGVAVSRRARSESEYPIAGRNLGLGLATFSMFATWFGAETCGSAAGKFYQHGRVGRLRDVGGRARGLGVRHLDRRMGLPVPDLTGGGPGCVLVGGPDGVARRVDSGRTVISAGRRYLSRRKSW